MVISRVHDVTKGYSQVAGGYNTVLNVPVRHETLVRSNICKYCKMVGIFTMCQRSLRYTLLNYRG
jgi:hypothetical protein